MKLAQPGSRAARRITKELEKLREDQSNHNLTIEAPSIDTWFVTFIGAAGTVYEGEVYTLQVRFTEDYPMDSPEVTFVLPAPVHPHIYTNGHICLNILGNDWSPALSVQSICLSIQSMLSSATVKELPLDNDRYVSVPNRGPKSTRFMYHDDSV